MPIASTAKGWKDRARPGEKADWPQLHTRIAGKRHVEPRSHDVDRDGSSGSPGPPPLDEQAAADIFAYFYAVRFFLTSRETPPAAKRLFLFQNIARSAMELTLPKWADGQPVIQWQTLGHPILLAEAMWNHAANMRQAFAQQKDFLAGDLRAGPDRHAGLFAQSPGDATVGRARLETAAGEEGRSAVPTERLRQAAIQESSNWRRALKGQTLTENRGGYVGPRARKWRSLRPSWSRARLRQIVSYLWTQSIFQDIGNPVEGRKVFASKNCTTCHNDASSGEPSFASPAGEPFPLFPWFLLFWRHGPRMLQEMEAKHLAWAKFHGAADVRSDLVSECRRPTVKKPTQQTYP